VQVEMFHVMSSNAPSELVNFVVQYQGNFFNSFPGSGAMNVSTRIHLHISLMVRLIPIRLYVTMSNFKEVKWGQTQYNIILTHKTRLVCRIS
jgi:hypothetical protein